MNLKKANLLELFGVRENNLKNLDLTIKHNQLTVITGLSGSGKSTLAFDTIYAEGARRYIETFSPYTRQFLDRLKEPDISAITGVRPSLALEQINKITTSRSTVGTVTEINDYLKVLWANLSEIYCSKCDLPVKRDTPSSTLGAIKDILRDDQIEQLLICFKIKIKGLSTLGSLVTTLEAQGLTRYYCDKTKEAKYLNELLEEKKKKLSEILIVVDRIKQNSFDAEHLLSSINQAFTLGLGELHIIGLSADKKELILKTFREALICSSCGERLHAPKTYLFSFNSPLGACPTCQGFGRVLAVDPALCVPNPNLSIKQGAIACWKTPATAKELKKLIIFCKDKGIDINAPWETLTKEHRDLIFQGEKKYYGIKKWFKWLETKRHKMHVRVFMSHFRKESICPDCQGSRLREVAANYRILGKTLQDIWNTPLDNLHGFFSELRALQHSKALDVALEEIISRLTYLLEIGLGYLTLDRQTRTLSGGEYQRVNLTSLLGSRLVNTTLVLDEPTIGLHQQDTFRLINTLKKLKERGNTLIVVEHEKEVIKAADEIIDIGVYSGKNGGKIVYQGDYQGLLKSKESLTAKALLEDFNYQTPISSKKNNRFLKIKRARAHNLKAVDIEIPLGKFVVLSGVSGSGKSSLIEKCLVQPYARLKDGLNLKQLKFEFADVLDGIEGLEDLEEVVFINQSPIGKTPRSNSATYTKVWDQIRENLAATEEAQKLGLSKSAFSFNVDGGRCPNCQGAGAIKIEMQFLADVYVQCEICKGMRFQDKVLDVRYHGKNVIDFLAMTLDEVVEFYTTQGEDLNNRIIQGLMPLVTLGLGYLQLGHPLSLLSGGESQRLKIASELAETKSKNKLFIFDEPTTGLHPYNIEQLLSSLRELIKRGHSVLCVEHNLDVIKQADWIIDLGPGGGDSGGEVVASGEVENLIRNSKNYLLSQTVAVLTEGANQNNLPQENKIVSIAKDAPLEIEVIGAREHNLKNISVDIPHNKFTVVTGVSGSGKSTLAFDIIFAEGQRRYIDCLSPYARQYLKELSRADVDRVNAIPPTVAISQKTTPPMGVSTIATVTEIYQFLRLLYAKVGSQHCPEHDLPITTYSSSVIADELINKFSGQRLFVFAPVISGRKGIYQDLFERAYRAELTEAKVDGKIIKINPELRLERHKLHWISLLVGSLTVSEKNLTILLQAIEQALLLGNGVIEVTKDKYEEPLIYSTDRVCPKCKRGYRELDPQDFSFRSARGVCECCQGRGIIEKGKKNIETIKCPECHGARVARIARHVYINGKKINELTSLTAPKLLEYLDGLEFSAYQLPIIKPILKELRSHLKVISEVGLDYIILDRDASSISGGEAQRLRLAKALGSPLTGVCYILDEPSIGLHPQDQDKIMQTIFSLKDAGNTVIVVEHDEETIRLAEHIVDVGPVGGANGGHIVVEGSLKQLLKSETSLTAKALNERKKISFKECELTKTKNWLEIKGAHCNNLKNINVKLPLNKFVVIAGVSGAGKSSLLHGCIVPAVESILKKGKEENKCWESLSGAESFERLVQIDQSPVGKTVTSTPASYLGIFDDIRKLYANLPDAKVRGYNASYFSYNSGKGKCPECSGKGFIRVPMSFLPQATVLCECCKGLRYTDEALEILYQGVSLGELLKKTMSEAAEILTNHKLVKRTLDYINELGLGYLTLGQPTFTLSGGEVQRLKIAYELGSREARDTLYVLDEPTIGLHMTDVDKLVGVLNKLVNLGNTVVVIEHNLDILRAADYLIEIGPQAGERGGNLLYQGEPIGLKDIKELTPTKKFLFAKELPKTKDQAIK